MAILLRGVFSRSALFGLVAEDSAKVNPDLVVRDKKENIQRQLRPGEREVAQSVS